MSRNFISFAPEQFPLAVALRARETEKSVNAKVEVGRESKPCRFALTRTPLLLRQSSILIELLYKAD